jgi:c-di-GMP-related signal transduction protein
VKTLTAVEDFEKWHLALQKAMMCNEMAKRKSAQEMQLWPVESQVNRKH